MKQLLRMLGLLLALALRLPAAWGNPIVAYVQSTVQTGDGTVGYRIAGLVAVPDNGRTITNYTLTNVPANAQGGRLAYPTNADGSGGNGLTIAVNNAVITQAQADNLLFAPANGFSGAVNNGGAFNPRSFTFTANQSNGVGTTADYTVFVAGYNTTSNTFNIIGANQTAANIPNVTTTGNAVALPALTATINNNTTLTGYRILTLPAAAAGTLYVNGTAATANQNLTAAQAAQLTFVPSGNTYQGAPFFTYSGYSGTTAGAPGYYTLPVSRSGNVLIDPIDLSRRASGEDWKTNGSITVNNTTLTHRDYTSAGVTGTNTNTFAIGNLAGFLPGPALGWQLNPQGSDPATAPTQSQVTLSFDRAVTNLSLTLTDIDRDIVNASFIDELDLNAYSTDAATTPLSLATNATVTLANAQVNQLVAGTNTLQGIGTSNADANGTVVVTFSSPVKRLVLTFRNTAPYVSATTNRTHTMGITSLTWLAQADLTTTLTGPGSLTSGLQSGNYTVTYTNNGPEPAASTTRTVTVPYQYVQSVSAPGGTVSGGGTTDFLITYPAGTSVPAGSSGQVSYTFTITPTALTSNGQSIAIVSRTAPGTGGTDQGSNTATDQATVSYVVGAIADVGVSFSSGQADNSTVVAGTTVTYGVTFTNAGPSTASDVTRTVSIPAGVPSVTSTSADGVVSGSQAAGWTITYPGGSVPLNATGTAYGFSYVAPATGPVVITARTTTSTSQGANTAADQATRTLNVTPVAVSGTVFDDVNYGGGAGRTYATANTSAKASGFADNAIGRPNAQVEIYNGAGAFVGATTTGANGAYSYSLPSQGSYTVRVVNSTVTPTRAVTANAAVVPVQTYVFGNANRVGGENPQYTDAGANTGSQSLSDLTTGAVLPQSVYTATFNATGTTNTGLDFGFNFDTVVNTNDVATVSGNNAQGSLRQFILNANALANTNLKQDQASSGGATPAAGVETSIFMISDGATHPGLRAGLANQLTTQTVNGTNYQVASIATAAALPQLTNATTAANAAFTSIDGSTQTQNVGDTNSTTLGTGGTVGTLNGGIALSQVAGPEVQLVGNRAGYEGLSTLANNTTFRALSLYGFSNNIGVGTDVTSLLIEQNVLGASASSFTDPGATARTTGQGINLYNSDNGTVQNNLIGFNGGMGIWVLGDVNGASNNRILGNEIRGNAQEVNVGNGERLVFDGLELQGASTGNTVSGNLITASLGHGIDSYGNAVGGNTITNNTISGNGVGVATSTGEEGSGLRVYGATNTTTISYNVLSNNNGSGVLVENTAAKVVMTQNSIFGNTRLGIDLLTNADAATTANQYNGNTGTTTNVTLNSAATTGGNGLVNYPVITSATISGNNLTVSGYAKAGATIELFTAQANSSTAATPNNLFGQGRTYLGTVTEGSAADTDTRTGLPYSGNINGFNQGSDTNANGFTFTIPLGTALPAGTLLTSTATLGGSTSEFSGNVSTVALTGYVYEDVNYGGGLGRPRTAAGAVTRPGAKVELYDANGNYVSTAITDANGQYAFATTPGNYTVRVVNNSVLSSRAGATAASGTATTGYVSNQLPVQTYNGTTSRVGGENPAYTDAAANTGTQTLASLTSGTVTPESISAVTVGSAATTGPDFGFNFDLVVNTNDVATVSGNNAQGSLRQFILNSNALGGETNLAPVYTSATGTTTALATGLETSIFMIPNGTAVAGQRAGLTNAAGTANFTTPNNGSGTAATIALAAALPDVTGPATALNGNTQTRSTGDSNQPVTTLGSESTGPEVLVNLTGKAGLTIQGNSDQVVALSLYNSVNSGQGLLVGANAVTTVVQNSTINNNGANITFQAANAPSAATISGNIIRDSQRGTADGLELNGNNSNMTITGNQFLRNAAMGIDFIAGSNTGNTITNNTFAYNGALPANNQQSGIAFRAGGSNNNLVQGNTFLNNSGAGVVVKAGSTGNRILQNSFSGNGSNPYAQGGAYTAPAGLGLGIDLAATEPSGTSYNVGDGVTLNDNGDTDGGGNGLLNFPIIQSAVINANGTVTVTGFARPNVTVELYLAADDPTHFGEGQTFVTSFQQGNAAGTVNGVTTGTASTYGPGALNDGLNQGTDNTLTYSYTFTPTAAQLTALRQSTALLTSTATLGTADNGNFGTSEFSGNARIFQAPVPNDVTNVTVPNNTTTPVVLNPNLSGMAYGYTANVTSNTNNTIVSYTISAPSTGGTLYYNNGTTNVAVTGTTTVPVGNLGGLTFVPTQGFSGSVTFTYTALDANGLVSTQHNNGGTVSNGAATYTIQVTPTADVTASVTGGTSVTAGQPTGFYTATYTNLGSSTANGVLQTVTLPTGATLTQAQKDAITNAYQNTTFPVVNGNQTISFVTAATLANGSSNSFRFAFTAPATPGSSPLTASTGTTNPPDQGVNSAPDQASLTITTGALTDVLAAITNNNTGVVAPGGTATFVATLTNQTTNQPAANVVETVQLVPNLANLQVGGQTGTANAANTTLTFATSGAVYTIATGQLTYPATTLAGSGSTSSTITFTMPASGAVVGTVSATTTTAETSTANNVAAATITAGPSFDLSTSLTGPTAVVAGSPVTFTVSTLNNGPQAISGAVQTVNIPAGLTASGSGQNVFISNGGTYDSSTGNVTFPALGSLPAGQMVGNTITFTSPTSAFKPVATVTPGTATGTGDTNTANNTAYLNAAGANDATATLTPATATGTAANVYATLSTTSQIVSAGSTVTYAVGLGNAGPGTATSATGQLQLLPGLGVAALTVAGSQGTVNGNTITFADGANYKGVSYNTLTGVLSYAATSSPLASNSLINFNVGVVVPATVGNNGQLLATNAVGSQTSDNVPADNVKAVAVTVQTSTELATTLTGPTTGVTPGQSVTYVAGFTNSGPDAASVVTETVQLPTNLTAATLTVAGQTGMLNSGVISFSTGAASGARYTVSTGLLTLPALATDAVGAVQTFPISFPAPAQSYVVSSAIGGATPETTLANNAASVATTVAPTADVALSLAGPTVAVAGSAVTYTVTATNNGVNTATNVVPTLLLPKGLTILSSGPGTGATYDTNSGLLTFPATASLPAGTSAENYVTFTMPTAPTGGLVTATAAFTSDSYDNAASNNTAGLTTSLAPTTTSTDLLTTITPPTASPVANATVSYTLNYRNAGANSAAGVVATASLPTGLGASLVVANGTGTLSANTGLYTYPNGATYDPATGLLTQRYGTLAPSTTPSTLTVSFTAPAAGPLVVVSNISSTAPETDNSNNAASSTLSITPTSDLAAAITGPLSALPGVPGVYTATFSNVGASPAANVTPTTQLPTNLTTATLLVAGQAGTVSGTSITFPNGASYDPNSGLLTFPTIGSLATGAAGAVTQSFTVTMPATGSLTATAGYTAASIPASDPNTSNNSQSITTQNSPLSLAPVAENIVNSLQSARGNTSPTNLLISPLYATDRDGNIPSSGSYGYFVQSLPASGTGASAGTLYYNNTAISSIPAGGYQVPNPALLSFKPATGFVGNAFFNYSALDNSGVASNQALYTIPVAQDLSTTYNTHNTGKGNANPYVTGDILATTQDPNTDIFNSAGLIYNATTGALQTGAANGVSSASYTGTLPTGVTFATTATTILVNGATVQIPAGTVYVSNASQLPRVTSATNYNITVTTTDLNGGVNTVPVTITLGAYPLPVELVAFTAQAVQNRDGLLQWTTASELHNDHFEVERSLDGASFTKLGQVVGQGSKASATDYRFTDAGIGPKVAAGQPVYYRLKQVDLDGTATYSPVRTVSFTGTPVATVTLYPNPATTATGLDLRALPATGTYQVLLLDATGRQVRQATLGGGLLQPLDLHEVASGTYSVLVTGQQADGSPLRQVLRLLKE